MRPCKECKKEVSSKAKACPHCGAELQIPWVGMAVIAASFGCIGVSLLAAVLIGPPAWKMAQVAWPEIFGDAVKVGKNQQVLPFFVEGESRKEAIHRLGKPFFVFTAADTETGKSVLPPGFNYAIGWRDPAMGIFRGIFFDGAGLARQEWPIPRSVNFSAGSPLLCTNPKRRYWCEP